MCESTETFDTDDVMDRYENRWPTRTRHPRLPSAGQEETQWAATRSGSHAGISPARSATAHRLRWLTTALIAVLAFGGCSDDSPSQDAPSPATGDGGQVRRRRNHTCRSCRGAQQRSQRTGVTPRSRRHALVVNDRHRRCNAESRIQGGRGTSVISPEPASIPISFANGWCHRVHRRALPESFDVRLRGRTCGAYWPWAWASRAKQRWVTTPSRPSSWAGFLDRVARVYVMSSLATCEGVGASEPGVNRSGEVSSAVSSSTLWTRSVASSQSRVLRPALGAAESDGRARPGIVAHSSVWIRSDTSSQFPRLSGDDVVDVVVIGGGISGLMTAATGWSAYRCPRDARRGEGNYRSHDWQGDVAAWSDLQLAGRQARRGNSPEPRRGQSGRRGEGCRVGGDEERRL